MWAKQRGFTIVELLIVIVVIAIIAAISITSMTGANVRANNTARIDAAKKVINAVAVYHAESGSGAALLSALTSGSSACVGSGLTDVNSDGRGDCSYYGSPVTVSVSTNPTIDSLLSTTKFGTATPPVILSGSTFTGPMITHYASTTDGRATRLQVRYYLEGSNADCGIRVLRIVGSTYTAIGTHTNSTVSGNATVCIVDMSKYEN